MSITICVQRSEGDGEPRPILESDNPRIAVAALAAMLREADKGVSARPMLMALGILEADPAETDPFLEK